MSTAFPFVSIVVPARNEALRIESCVEALLRLDYPKDQLEIIVVDNGSTDDTAQRLSRYPVTRVAEQRVGPAFARNAGIRASRGDIIAFTDADCIADPNWMRELVAEAEMEDVGCFVGDITGLPAETTVSEYVTERRLICQERLLSCSPPVAAAGNIAYRRSVFSAVGLFDESFRNGEDGDLFWRMVKSDRFRVRYHRRAVVAHAHPAHMLELIRRSFHEGRGLARFRFKHSADLPSSMSSLRFALAGLVSAAVGLCKVPVRMVSLAAKGHPSRKYLLYPLLDKACSIPRLLGVICELARLKLGRENRTMNPGANPASAQSFNDRLVLDIANARLLRHADPDTTARVRNELLLVRQVLATAFPDASIILTASMFAGEGHVDVTDGRSILRSDYDFFVVSPRFMDTVPSRAKRKIDRLLRGVPLSTRLEIGLVWKPLLVHRRTTIGGAIVAGPTDIIPLLEELPAPNSFSALLQAYRSLTEAPLNRDRYAYFCSKGLVRAACAFLLEQRQGLSRKEWIGLSSIEIVRKQLGASVETLGPDAVDELMRAADYLLGRVSEGPVPAFHSRYAGILDRISGHVAPSRESLLATKHLLWLIHERRWSVPRRDAGLLVIQALGKLAGAWREPGGPDADRLDEIGRMVRCICRYNPNGAKASPVEFYTYLQAVLSSIAGFNPHKLIYEPSHPLI